MSHLRLEEEQVSIVMEGAGEEDAPVVAGGVEAAEDAGGEGGGPEGELEGADGLGVAAVLETVEVASGRAGAGPAAATL